jgi:hypothetical protein
MAGPSPATTTGAGGETFEALIPDRAKAPSSDTMSDSASVGQAVDQALAVITTKQPPGSRTAATAPARRVLSGTPWQVFAISTQCTWPGTSFARSYALSTSHDS